MRSDRAKLAKQLRRCWNAAAAAGLLICGGPLVAQDDPFGGAAPASKAPAAAPAAAKPAAVDATTEDDPAVRSILESKPASPDDWLRAVRNLINLGRPAVAVPYLDGLEKSEPTPQVWAELHAKYGTEFFLRLGKQAELQPAGDRVAKAALGAAQTLARDPARLADLISKFESDDPAIRRQSMLALRQVGSPAVTPLVAALADPSRAAAHRRIQATLVELGAFAVEPLVGALEAEDEAFRARVVETLGELRTLRSVGYLVRPAQPGAVGPELEAACRATLVRISDAVPDRRDAQHYLRKRIVDLLAGSLPAPIDYQNYGELWHWDARAKAPVARRYQPHELCAVEAARLAGELYLLDADSIDNRRLYLAADLEAAKLLAGLDRPLPSGPGSALARALSHGPAAIEDLLTEMMKRNRPVAAACAAEVLGEFGSPELVRSDSDQPRPLVLAVNAADRRLRYAALRSVLKLDLREPFAGSSYVGESLRYLAASVGSRRVLVAHPKLEDARSLVGLLKELGYDADSATNGRSTFIQAVKQPDYEFVLMSDLIDGPPARELLAQLRHDKRSAGLTVGVMVQLARFGSTDAAAAGEQPPADDGAEGGAGKEQGKERGKDQEAAGETATASADAAEKRVDSADRSFSVREYRRRDPIIDVAAIQRGSTYFDRTPSPVDPLIKVREWTIGDGRTTALARPYDQDGMHNFLTHLTAAAGRSAVPLEERLRQAEFAIDAIGKLAEFDARYEFYSPLTLQPALESSLQTPELAARSLAALGRFGTPKAQSLLVDFASQRGLPIEDRQAAVDAFRDAVARRSLRLTKVEVLRQYERYNGSEKDPPETQAVLAALLDVIESGVRKAPAGSPDARPDSAPRPADSPADSTADATADATDAGPPIAPAAGTPADADPADAAPADDADERAKAAADEPVDAAASVTPSDLNHAVRS